MTFKEGGAFDYHTNFERIRERLEQAVELQSDGARGARNVDMSAVHLEDLPAYEGPGNSSNSTVVGDAPVAPQQTRRASEAGPEPAEPPPCYEEVQSQSVATELEERLRRAS